MTIWTFPHVPASPDWRVDWDAIARRFAWIQALAGVPQEPAYHAEGDVLTHTRMVAAALAALDAWRALPPTERDLLFAAALLHDVARPGCTRTEASGGSPRRDMPVPAPSSRITSSGLVQDWTSQRPFLVAMQ